MATQTIKNPFLEASFNMNSYANSMLCYIYIVRLLNRDQIIKKIFQKINAVNLQNKDNKYHTVHVCNIPS